MEAQKVGLVLSGGGAKGLDSHWYYPCTEENEIPIDYINTSMVPLSAHFTLWGYSDEMETTI